MRVEFFLPALRHLEPSEGALDCGTVPTLERDAARSPCFASE